MIEPYWSARYKVMTQERTDWVAIGKQLHRNPKVCNKKWKTLINSRMKKGYFTAEEDALIRERVAAWGDKGEGLWVSLEKEMDRPRSIIGGRWHKKLSKL